MANSATLFVGLTTLLALPQSKADCLRYSVPTPPGFPDSWRRRLPVRPNLLLGPGQSAVKVSPPVGYSDRQIGLRFTTAHCVVALRRRQRCAAGAALTTRTCVHSFARQPQQ